MICDIGRTVDEVGWKGRARLSARQKTIDHCCKGHWFIFRNLFWETYYLWNYLLKRIVTMFVKYRNINKKNKWNECQVAKPILSSIFSGAWTPIFCEFTRKMSKFQQNEHTRFDEIWLKYFEFHTLWSLSSVDFSHFNIAIAYSNSKFCGAWTPSFCEFTCNFGKTSTPLRSVLQWG